jgi:adenosylcobinamide kinase/adenosylcobinamide-phosphate guanylyltransferase
MGKMVMAGKNKSETVLYLGGCRSGKSRLAEEYCRTHFGTRTYVATMTGTDDEEMQRRIELHRLQRGENWQLIEEPFDLYGVLSTQQTGTVVLVDCLTMWLTNRLLAGQTDKQIEQDVQALCQLLHGPPCTIVLVSNEVGLGIVPESALSRRFRDLAGWMNQQVAGASTKVYFVAAGLSVVLKDKGQPG